MKRLALSKSNRSARNSQVCEWDSAFRTGYWRIDGPLVIETLGMAAVMISRENLHVFLCKKMRVVSFMQSDLKGDLEELPQNGF